MSSVEYTALLKRVAALENKVNDLVTAIGKLVTTSSIVQLGLLKQTAISQLETRMDSVEARVDVLETYHQT